MKKHDAMNVASHSLTCTVAALLLASLNVTAAGMHQDVNNIETNSLNNLSGIIGVNTAAGDNNIQANTKSIAIGRHAQATTKSALSVQGLNSSDLNGNSIASVRIEANTLHNAHGLISVNQVAGSNNMQLNDITIAFGENAQVVSDISLSVRPTGQSNLVANDDNTNKNFYLDKDSLKGATGTIQINQIAGNGNIAVNRVSMPVQ